MRNNSFHIIVFPLLLLSTSISCQSKKTLISDNPPKERIYNIEGQFKILELDHLGNIYLIDQSNVLKKYNPEFELLFEFSLNRMGDLTHLDVSNPQKMLLYYSEFQNIIFLDNTLSGIKRLNLEELGYWDIQGVALSRENNIWIYDPINNSLLKINQNGELILNSNELYYENFHSVKLPRLFEQEENVFLYTTEGVYQFDNFGQYIRKYNLENENCQFLKDRILYLQDGNIKEKHLTIELQEQELIYYYYEKLSDFHLDRIKAYFLDMHGLWSESTN